MRNLQAAPMALEAIRRFRLRAVVAVVSVAVGVAAMVAIQSLAAAIHGLVMGELGRLGLDRLVLVHPRPARTPLEPVPMLTLGQVRELERSVPDLDSVVPMVPMDVEIQSGGRMAYARATGTVPGYRRLLGERMAAGRFLDETDDLTLRRVCVLGADLARRLLRGGDPVGRKVLLAGTPYTVVGVLQGRRLIDSAGGDDRLILPIRTMRSFHGGPPVIHGIHASLAAGADPSRAVAAVRRVLARGGQDLDRYEVLSGREFLEDINKALVAARVVTTATAGMALVVGAVGVLNTMLISVRQRIWEIGLRKALGARPMTIVSQFVTEAVVLSCCGGGLGLALGWGLARVGEAVLSGWLGTSMAGSTDWGSAGLALAVSLSVGICSGVAPAVQAAELPPAEAMRNAGRA